MSRKKIFLYINVNYHDSYQLNTKCTFYINKKQKKCETCMYIYKKPDTLEKARQFALHFYSQKLDTLHYTISMK